MLPLLEADPVASPSPVVLMGQDGRQVRVEALDPHIVRIWAKPAGHSFVRPSSLALETAPVGRVGLQVEQAGGKTRISTGALVVELERDTLALSARAGNAPLLEAGAWGFPAQGASQWSLQLPVAPEEALLGLGQDNQNNGRLNRCGVIRELWAGQKINSGNVTAEYPVPLLISTGRKEHAYGLFFDNSHKLRFDLAKTAPDKVRLDAEGGEMDLYLIDGPSMPEIIERYTRLTGRPSLPPLWALGYWQSKCTYYDWKPLDEAYRQLAERGFPVDAFVIDYDWPEVANNFRWAPRWSAEGKTPAEKIADYAAKGVKIILSQSGPMIRQESPTFATGWAAGVFATDGKGNPIECGHFGGKLLDFSHPAMKDWLWPQLSPRNKEGVAAWWLDLTEPEGEPPQTQYHGGSPANVHNEYSLLCSRSFEASQLADNPDKRPFILTRSASAGSQRHHVAVWTGDIYSDYATLRAHPPEMLNSGLSGLVWWTSDSGGFMTGYYKDDQMGAHGRLYERWMQLSVFSPITRSHKAGGLPEPYQFGPAVEQGCLHYLKLRYQLMPYIYSHAWEASVTGMPLARALALEFPDDPNAVAAPGDQYLFGGSLLVAPVTHEGQNNRAVYFPKGRWFDWDTGVEYAGGRSWVVAAPQNRIPVAVRAGAIIPMAPEMRHTGEKPWDPLTVAVWPSGRSSFTLYRDDGYSFAHRRGEHTVTLLESEEAPRELRLTITESNKKFTPAAYRLQLHLAAAPLGLCTDAGQALPFVWDAEARILTADYAAPKALLRHQLRVTLSGERLPPRPAPVLEESRIDPSGEATGSAGRPVPHFFPAPALPGRFKAINYDKGGEGVAFHSTRPLPSKPRYRQDDFSLRDGADVGGGFVLGDLRAGEWARYTVDCGNGGWFDLGARVAGAKAGGRLRVVAQDRVVAMVEVPATGGDDTWTDVVVPGVYLNPGELSLMLYVDQPGFRLNTVEFRRAAAAPRIYPAVFAARSGFAEAERTGGSASKGAVANLGRLGSSLSFGVVAPSAGEATLRIRYQNTRGKALPYSARLGGVEFLQLQLPDTGGRWVDFDLKAPLAAGANAFSLHGLVDGYDGITLEQLELLLP